MEKSRVEDKISPDQTATRTGGIAIISIFVVVISQWICLLAVLEPHRWIAAASVARWFYALSQSIILVSGFIALIVPRSTLPTQLGVTHIILSMVCSLIVLYALMAWYFGVALVVGLGWTTFGIVKNWLLSETEYGEVTLVKPQTGTVLHLVFFLMLCATLAFRSVSLSHLLFMGMIMYWVVAIVKAKNPTRR